MNNNNKIYIYQVLLEIALKTSDYSFGYINISHISYEKLYQIFHEQIIDERFMFEKNNYLIDEELFVKHKEFFEREIPFSFDFKLFEYSICLVSVRRSDYRNDYHEDLPPLIDNG